MLETFTRWIRGLWERIMISRDTIRTVFKVEPPQMDTMTDAIQLWAKMYANEAPWLTSDIKSLNLSAAIANEVARSVTIEAKVAVEGSARAIFLNDVMQRVLDEVREQAEYAVALGGMVFKPYVDDNNQIAIDYVKADSFYPMEFDSDGNLTAAIFIDKRQVGNNWLTRLEYHKMVTGGCEVYNMAFKSTSEATLGTRTDLGAVAEWAKLSPIATIVGIDRPLFAYFRYPMANNLDPKSKLGMSCYSRATELIEQADRQWSNFLWEFESGQRALYVDTLAFAKDPVTGKPVLPNKRLIRTLDAGGSEDNLFEDWSPTFRQLDLLAGLDAILKRIEFTVGLAYGTLSNPNETEKTATEILSAKQRTYSTIVDTQKALQDALEHLLWAIDQWATISGLAPAGTYNTAFEFDDSVVVDKDMQFQSDLRLVSAGIMSKFEFRMRNLGEDEAEAKAKIAAVTAENPPLEMPFGA